MTGIRIEGGGGELLVILTAREAAKYRRVRVVVEEVLAEVEMAETREERERRDAERELLEEREIRERMEELGEDEEKPLQGGREVKLLMGDEIDQALEGLDRFWESLEGQAILAEERENETSFWAEKRGEIDQKTQTGQVEQGPKNVRAQSRIVEGLLEQAERSGGAQGRATMSGKRTYQGERQLQPRPGTEGPLR